MLNQKNQRRCYISGKITGLAPEVVAENFKEAAEHVVAMGFSPVSPVDIVGDVHCGWDKAMLVCINALFTVEAVYVMSNWWRSPGAKIELALAHGLGLRIIISDAMEIDGINRFLSQFNRTI